MPLHRNRIAAVLAVLAMALNALWPLIAQAQPKSLALSTTICSIDGSARSIDLLDGKAPADDGAAGHHKHCKLCIVGGDRAQALLPAPVVSFQNPAPAAETPAPAPVADLRFLAASPAQPRAPPFQS